jgi:hypothetical protein
MLRDRQYLIHVFLLMICIFDQGGGQLVNCKLKYPFNAFITRSASPAINDLQLMLSSQILSEWRRDCVACSFAHGGWQYIGYGE